MANFKKLILRDIHKGARIKRAQDRDIVLGIGPEGYADLYDVTLSRQSGGTYRRLERDEHKKNLNQGRERRQEEEGSSQTSEANSKRSASSPPADEREVKKVKQSTELDEDERSEMATEENSFTPSKDLRVFATPADNPTLRQTSTPAKADADDSDDCMLVEVRDKTPATKRTTSATPRGESMKKRRKQTADSDGESSGETPQLKRPAVAPTSSVGRGSAPSGKKVKQGRDADEQSETETPSVKRQSTVLTSIRGRIVKPSQKRQEQVEDSESGDEESDEDGEDDTSDLAEEDEDEEGDPRAANQKLLKANEELKRSCRTCKTNANRALKTKYETEYRQLKSKSKRELAEAKAKARQEMRAAKSKADEDKEGQKNRYETRIKELRSRHDEKIATLLDSRDDIQGKYEEMKDKLEKKNKKLTKERDDAEAKRKEVDRTTHKELFDIRADMKADQLRLNEERKTMQREKTRQINELKPEHSSQLKIKERDNRRLEDKALGLEAELRETEDELRRVRTAAAADRQRLVKSRAEVDRAARQVKAVENNLREFNTYTTAVEGRAASNIARADEQVRASLEKLQHEKNRVVEQSRINKQLRESLQVQAQRGREKDGKIRELEAELKATKAEVGLAAEMEEL